MIGISYVIKIRDDRINDTQWMGGTMKFNINGSFFQFMNALAEFILLNIVFIICCLPIVTIGPALSALYGVTIQEAKQEHGYVIKKFFKIFKESFLKSLLVSIIFFTLGFVVLFNLFFWGSLGTIFANFVFLLMTLLALILTIMIIYAFPLMARYENTLKNTLKNSFGIAMENRGYTLALLGIHGVTVGLCFFLSQMRIFMIFIGFAFIAYCNSFLFQRVFEKYERKQMN